MKNSDYWQKRGELTQNILLQKADSFIDDMERSYKEAYNSIENEINVFFQRFAVNEGLSMNDAKKLLNSKEVEKFKMTVEEYIKKGQENAISDMWRKELESASNLYRIDRLKSLQIQINQQIEMLSAYKNIGTEKTLKDIFEESYYRNIFDVQQFLGYGKAFEILDTKTINSAIIKPWTYDGETFSKRIWKDNNKLKYSLDKILTQGIIRGSPPDKISKAIAKEMNTSLSNAKRLVLTETAVFSAKGRDKSYQELNVDEIEFVASLDEKTCAECGGMDGKHYPRSSGEIGKNLPPLHPYCRCTTAPYFDDEFTEGEERFARDEKGNGYYVPSDMTFKEWHSKYVIPNIKEPKFIPIRNIDEINDDIIKRLNYEMNLISDNHKDIIKSEVKSIEFVGDESSRYDRKKGILYLRKDFIPGELIHEFGHAIETNLDLYHNQRFLDILENGLEDITPFDIIEDMETFVEPVQRLDVPKFISEYQGFIYEVDTDGNGIILSSGKFNIKSLGEYFSEAYREFYTNPYNLKQKDFNLYKFIEELD